MTARDIIFDDPLEDLFNAAAEQPSQARALPPSPPPTYKRPAYDEPCRKCGGSGRFVSASSGRSLGACYACKGRGRRTFARPAEARARSRAVAAERKVRVRLESIEAFKAAHPDVWAWMDGSTYPFAVSMRESLAEYGDLTERQLAAAKSAAGKLAAAREAAAARKAAEAASAVRADVGKMQEVFRQLADSGLKRIKVFIRSYVFEPSYKYAGSVAVMSGGRFLGRIDEGRLLGFRCDEATQREIAEIASDPKTAALAHGLETGQCAICGAELTNPESVARGIGPICAGRVGW